MDKITENANNLAKTLATTIATDRYLQFVDPSTGAVSNITLANLAKAVADINVQAETNLPSGVVYASVDLGLPSGTLWATHNIGATKPEEYGDLFAWGATEPYRMSGSTVLDTNDNYAASYASTIQHDPYPNEDAATVKWGKGWCMPTKAQFDELIANTTSEWTTQNEIVGRKFTSSNGNSIFFPAAGFIYNDALNFRGRHGNYWSRTCNSSERAWHVYVGSESKEMYAGERLNGFSVRPVRR